MPLLIEHIPTPTDEARSLIEELETELSSPYTPEQRHGLSVHQIFQPHILFFIARLDGVPVACAGIAFEPDYAELKRMYVRPQARRQHIAQSLLAHLEQTARARGTTRLLLETGDILLPAITLYQRAGFTPCAPFGAYATMPPSSIERSVFLEKRLT